MSATPQRLGWTAADQAELDVLVGELLDAFERHLGKGCAGCRRAVRTPPALSVSHDGTSSHGVTLPEGVGDIDWPSGPVERYKPASRPAPSRIILGSVCPAIVAGVHVLLDWREQRMRRTRAEWLRAELDLIEWALEARRQSNMLERAA